MTFAPLAGLRVVDLSRLLPGPYLTRQLADLGADVIKVEPPEGDALRASPAAFAALNYGKRALAVDLKNEWGRAVVLALLEHADILVESFRPGVLARLGLIDLSPRLIVCSLTGYGQTGDQRDAPGHDLAYMARSGALSLFGPWDAAPVVPGVQVADLAGGSLPALAGIMAALLERQRTGQGRHLDISLTRGASAMLAMELPRQAAGEVEARGAGALTGGLPCYRVYATKDGRYMALAALEPRFFSAFCARAGCPDIDGQGLTPSPVIVQALAAVFLRRTQAEWIALLRGSEACCEPVLSPLEADTATVEVSGTRALATDIGAGPCFASSRRVPELGADNDVILSDLSPVLAERARASGALRP